MSSFSKISTLLVFGVIIAIAIATDLWLSPQLSRECVYNYNWPPSWWLHTGFFGGEGGTLITTTKQQGRIHSISWGISKELPTLNIDYDAVANLQFASDMQYKHVVFGSDPVDLCTPFVLQNGDHISGFRVIYGQFVHALYFHTKNGLSYQCVANISNIANMSLNDTGDVYINNSYLSGFEMRAAGVIDAIDLHFTVCAYLTTAPTSDPTIEPITDPTWPTIEPTMTTSLPTQTPTIVTLSPTPSSAPTLSPSSSPTAMSLSPSMSPSSSPSISPTLSPTISPTPSPTVDNESIALWIIIVLSSVIICFVGYCLYLFCLNKCQKRQLYKVDKALVLIIAISKFDNPKFANLPGVVSNVRKLAYLWTRSFNYDVYVCRRCTKNDIIDFVDDATETLISSYKAVVVHILSHGSGASEKRFVTSDSKTMEIDFINHELSDAAAFSNNADLVKIIFYDAKNSSNAMVDDGDEELKFDEEKESNYDTGTRLRCSMGNNYNVNRSDPNLNCVTIYVTTKHGERCDDGAFTQCICDVFGTSVISRNGCFNFQKQKDLNLLISDVSMELSRNTNHSQICSSNGMATIQKKIIFKFCSKMS